VHVLSDIYVEVSSFVLQNDTHIAELRKLTEFCEFGLNLNDTLRDRFVCGLRNDQIQKKLLTIRELLLDKALEIAVAMETATKDAIELRNVHGDTHFHANKHCKSEDHHFFHG
jgi:hypothetical protein